MWHQILKEIFKIKVNTTYVGQLQKNPTQNKLLRTKWFCIKYTLQVAFCEKVVDSYWDYKILGGIKPTKPKAFAEKFVTSSTKNQKKL